MKHIVHIITSLQRGGAERTLVRLITNTPPNTVQHSIICLADGGPLLEEVRPYLKHFIICPKNFFKLIKILRKWQPDAIQTWMYYSNVLGGLIAKFIGIKKIFWNIRITKLEWKYHDFKSFLFYIIGSYLSHIIPHRIIYCSKSGVTFHESKGYCKEKSAFIPNGLELQAYHNASTQKNSMRTKLKINKNTFIIGMLARFDPQKDFETFFKAASLFVIKHPDTKFLLAGHQVIYENRELLKLIPNAIRDHVILLGSNADVNRIYACLDICTLASMAEGFPNVVAEAMACGIPTVASDVGDAKFIIADTGWTVPPRDPAALANIWEIAINSDLKAKGIAARQRIEQNFSVEKMIHAYTSLYQS